MKTMRKNFALVILALLSLTMALAAVSCGKKAEETPAATETTPPDNSMMSDTSMHDSTMADTSMHN